MSSSLRSAGFSSAGHSTTIEIDRSPMSTSWSMPPFLPAKANDQPVGSTLAVCGWPWSMKIVSGGNVGLAIVTVVPDCLDQWTTAVAMLFGSPANWSSSYRILEWSKDVNAKSVPPHRPLTPLPPAPG